MFLRFFLHWCLLDDGIITNVGTVVPPAVFLFCPAYVYIFEFKLNSTAEVALKQIDEKGYALPYAADKRPLYKVGISFSSKTGTVNDFDYKPRQA